MLTTTNPTQDGELDASCRGIEAAEKPVEVAAPTTQVVVTPDSCKSDEKDGKKTEQKDRAQNAEKRAKSPEGGNNNAETCLQMLLEEAKRLLFQAQKEVKQREERVLELEKRLATVVETNKNKNQEKPKTQTEDERRAMIRRRWRILGMKVRVGITANIVKRRKMNDPNSFVVKDTEVVRKEDELDLEGACKRKAKIRSKWRKAGFGAGITQGRDCAF
eukprot:TRINITY_DN8216_c0_g2_i2.p1 TRINITY_DN8216_c0_g2~~TRINITY_DN8216_c0_g2_i2.p1  ORF type:complete len:218 (-),score=71.21 TRINITY_DN8216_c0_g2_i2:513-1166(-)